MRQTQWAHQVPRIIFADESLLQQLSLSLLYLVSLDTALVYRDSIVTLSIPATSQEAVTRIIVESALAATSLSLIDLQRITGFHNFVTVVVPVGRIFLRWLYNMKLHFPEY